MSTISSNFKTVLRSKTLAATLMAGASSMLLVGASHAQSTASTAEAASTAVVSEVLVTAERRETNLQNTPIAISAFTPQTLRDRDAESIRDLAGQIPNLYIARSNISYTTQTYSLRGVGETDPIQEPVLAVYVDDVYVPRQIGSMVDFNDIDRVEVLRGPQGTLYGRNSSAGALRIVTRDPGDASRLDASVGYGNFNDIEAHASVSGPIAPDKLYASLSYVHHSRDGTAFDPTLGHDVNRVDIDALRAKLRATPTDKLDIELTLTGLRDRSDSRSYIPVAQPGPFNPRLSYSEVEPYQHLNQGSAALKIQYDLSSQFKLKSITAFGGFDLDPVYYDNDGVAALIQKNLIHYNDQYNTQEVQLNGDFGRLNFTSGVFYLHERFFVQRDGYSRKTALATDPAVTPGNYLFLRAHNITYTDSFAAFGEANLKLTDRLTLTGGIRWTDESKTFVFNNGVLNLQGQVTAPSIQGQASKSWTAATPKASLQYQWTPDILQYATFSEGFKSGGFDNRATRLDLATLPFNPEKVRAYETGLKTEWFAHRLRANLAAFYDDYTDLQVSFYDPAYVGSRRGNAGKAHSYGVELESEAKPVDRISLFFNAGYLFAVYDQYKGAGGLGVDADGNRLINAPRWTLAGGASYDLPIQVSGDLRLGADLEYQSFVFAGPLNRPQDLVPGQTFVNGTVTWTAPGARWSVQLAGRNLFNSQQPISSSYTPSSGIYFKNYPDPRTVIATLRYAY